VSPFVALLAPKPGAHREIIFGSFPFPSSARNLPHGLKIILLLFDLKDIPHTFLFPQFSSIFQAKNPKPYPGSHFEIALIMCNTMQSSPAQVIEGQYLDQQKLMLLLKTVYGTSEEGKNNFRVEVNPMTLFQGLLLT
jgi:hypothetical protein